MQLYLTFCLYSQANENLRGELEEDVQEECGKLGPLDWIKVFFCFPFISYFEPIFRISQT